MTLDCPFALHDGRVTVVPEQLDAFAQALGVKPDLVIFKQIYIDFMMLELLH